MQRIAEPELMNDPAQALAYAQADFEQSNSLFIQHFQRIFNAWPGLGTALDLGCGPADITLRFAFAYPQCQVHGVDGAPAMLSLGHQAVNQAGLAQQVQLFLCHLPCTLPGENYAAIFSNSLLHHLFHPDDFWRIVRQAGVSGAPVLVMDLLRPDTPEQAIHLMHQYANDEPEILRHDFYNSLLAAYSIEEVQAQLLKVGLLGWGVQQCSDRHWFVAGYLP